MGDWTSVVPPYGLSSPRQKDGEHRCAATDCARRANQGSGPSSLRHEPWAWSHREMHRLTRHRTPTDSLCASDRSSRHDYTHLRAQCLGQIGVRQQEVGNEANSGGKRPNEDPRSAQVNPLVSPPRQKVRGRPHQRVLRISFVLSTIRRRRRDSQSSCRSSFSVELLSL